MSPSPVIWTWPTISRTLGVAISLIVLLVWASAFIMNRTLEPAIPLALLGIATLLFTGPSGVQLIVQRRNGSGPHS